MSFESLDFICVLIFCFVESVKPTGADETPESLWGEGKADPKEALESNGFQMRKVALQAAPGGGRRRGRGRRSNGKKADGEAKAAEAPAAPAAPAE
jgi:hypothetical protein